MEVTVEGTEITPETLREPGWLPAHRKHRHKSPAAETTPATRQQSTPSSKFRPRKLPPLPQLPAEDYKVVIRLQGGFNAKSWSAAQISDSIQHCAQLRSGADKDIIRTMPEQNIVIASTPEEDNAVAYCSLKEVKIGARTYSSTTYVTAPDNSAKGVIHNIPSYDSPADIERSLERNTPRVLQARRLGETASVLIVFEGKSVPYYVNYRNTTYRCLLYRRKIEVCENCYKVGHRKDICPTPDDKRCSKCGTLAPEGSHECTLRCAICGGEHMSGSKACQHRFHAPQKAARRQQTANEEATPPTSRPGIGRQSRSKDRRSAAESAYASQGTSRSRSARRRSQSARGRSRSAGGGRGLIGQKADRGDSNSAGGEENQRPSRGSTTTKVTWASVTDPSTHQRANRDNENQMLRAEIMQLRQMLQRQNALIEQLQRERRPLASPNPVQVNAPADTEQMDVPRAAPKRKAVETDEGPHENPNTTAPHTELAPAVKPQDIARLETMIQNIMTVIQTQHRENTVRHQETTAQLQTLTGNTLDLEKNMKRLETRLTPLEGTVQQMQQQCRPSRFESPSRSTTPQGMDPIRLSEPMYSTRNISHQDDQR